MNLTRLVPAHEDFPTSDFQPTEGTATMHLTSNQGKSGIVLLSWRHSQKSLPLLYVVLLYFKLPFVSVKLTRAPLTILGGMGGTLVASPR